MVFTVILTARGWTRGRRVCMAVRRALTAPGAWRFAPVIKGQCQGTQPDKKFAIGPWAPKVTGLDDTDALPPRLTAALS